MQILRPTPDLRSGETGCALQGTPRRPGRSGSRAGLTLRAVQAREALLAVALARVAEAVAAAVAGAAPLAAVLRREVLVAPAQAAHAHALPAAVPGAGGVGAVGPHEGLGAQAAAVLAAPVAAARPGAGGHLAGGALPALLAAAAAGLLGEGPVAAAVAAQTCGGRKDRDAGSGGGLLPWDTEEQALRGWRTVGAAPSNLGRL